MGSSRAKWLVSLSISSILGIVGFVWFPGATLQNGIDVGALVLAFLVPAHWIDSPADVWRHWPLVLGSIIAATLAWDGVTATVVVKRDFLMDWPIVYSGVDPVW